jgi:hypothetical protein
MLQMCSTEEKQTFFSFTRAKKIIFFFIISIIVLVFIIKVWNTPVRAPLPDCITICSIKGAEEDENRIA